jgi:hypothetical protein
MVSRAVLDSDWETVCDCIFFVCLRVYKGRLDDTFVFVGNLGVSGIGALLSGDHCRHHTLLLRLSGLYRPSFVRASSGRYTRNVFYICDESLYFVRHILGIVDVFGLMLFLFRYHSWFGRHLFDWLQVDFRDSNQSGFLDEL